MKRLFFCVFHSDDPLRCISGENESVEKMGKQVEKKDLTLIEKQGKEKLFRLSKVFLDKSSRHGISKEDAAAKEKVDSREKGRCSEGEKMGCGKAEVKASEREKSVEGQGAFRKKGESQKGQKQSHLLPVEDGQGDKGAWRRKNRGQ